MEPNCKRSHTQASIGSGVILAMVLAFFSCHRGASPLPRSLPEPQTPLELRLVSPQQPAPVQSVEHVEITPTPVKLSVKHFAIHNGAIILKDHDGRRYLIEPGVVIPSPIHKDYFEVDAASLIPIPDELPLDLIQYDTVKNESVIKLLHKPSTTK